MLPFSELENRITHILGNIAAYSLGIERDQMPQIQGNKVSELLDLFRQNNVIIYNREVPVMSLKASQNELSLEKIRDVITSGSITSLRNNPIIVSRDNYVIDGHHRWAGLYVLDPEETIKTYIVNLTAYDTITMLNLWKDNYKNG